MTYKLCIPALAAAALVSGCNKQDHTIVAGDRPSNQSAAAPLDPASLPPAIIASKTYRCKDNSLVYIDWLVGDKSANFRTAQNEPPTHLAAAEAGAALTAEGYSLKGDAKAKSIALTRPGNGAQTCHA